MRNRTDAELVAIKATDPAAEAELYERYKKLASDITRSFNVPGTDAEDLVSEAWIKLLEAIRRFDPAGGTQLKTWVRLTVTRRLMDLREEALKGGRVPKALTLSIDGQADTDGRDFHEILDNGEDVAGEVIEGMESSEAFRVIADSRAILRDIMESIPLAEVADEHMLTVEEVDGLVSLTKAAMRCAGHDDVLAQFTRLVTPRVKAKEKGHLALFGFAEWVGEEERDYIAAVGFKVARQLFRRVLNDTARGLQTDEIVAARNITRKDIAMILAIARAFLVSRAA